MEQVLTTVRKIYLTAPYAVALALVIGVIALVATVGEFAIGRVLIAAVLAAALLIPFSEARGGLRARIPVLATIISVFGVLAAELVLDENAGVVFASTCLVVAAAALTYSLRRIVRREPITADKVCAALTAYLLIGYGFAMGFALINTLFSEPFFAQEGEGSPNDFIYFSLITLTTVGYGDLTARSEETRLIASIEAVTGQLFLVSVVAILVGRLVAASPIQDNAATGLFDDPSSRYGSENGSPIAPADELVDQEDPVDAR